MEFVLANLLNMIYVIVFTFLVCHLNEVSFIVDHFLLLNYSPGDAEVGSF